MNGSVLGRVMLSTVALMPTLAFAQPASVAQTSVAPTEWTLKVTPSELDLISEGLQTQPFGKVVPLMNKLRQQIVDQQPKPVEAPK